MNKIILCALLLVSTYGQACGKINQKLYAKCIPLQQLQISVKDDAREQKCKNKKCFYIDDKKIEKKQ